MNLPAEPSPDFLEAREKLASTPPDSPQYTLVLGLFAAAYRRAVKRRYEQALSTRRYEEFRTR
jgi:hypothetical protein